MTSSAYPNGPGDSPRARRAELSPRTAGLHGSGTPRRVAGLRREEVALLAAISTDCYTRLEQGRVQPFAAILAAVARVLHLDDDQRDHVFALAGSPGGRPRRRTAQRVQPQLRRLLDNLTTVPGMVVGRSTDILAWNPLAAALLTDFAKVPEKKRNYARILFTDPAMKSLYADWELTARTVVARLRTRAAEYPDDPQLALLVGELSMQSPEFRRWWGAHPVLARTMGTKAFRHPVVGPLTLDWNLLSCSTDAGQELVIWTAEPGTPSYEGLQILCSWGATATGCATL
jgi:MmyB-like transcription regulator ligand binding domain/Helix-turn-helix domain